jgi:hypothetical protein
VSGRGTPGSYPAHALNRLCGVHTGRAAVISYLRAGR